MYHKPGLPIIMVGIVMFISLNSVVSYSQIGPGTTSFRNASTSNTGLLEDDLDLLIGYRGILDPARISLVEGKRLYTNLANIVDKNEEVFRDPFGRDNGYFLIGGSAKVWNVGTAGSFYDRNIGSVPESTGIGNFLGHGEETQVTHTNIGGMLIRDVVKRTADAKRDSSLGQFLLGVSRLWGERRWGVAYYRSNEKITDLDPGDTLNPYGNFTYEQTTTNLITGQVSLTDSWSGKQKTEEHIGRNVFAASIWAPFRGKFECGLAMSFGLLSDSPKDEANFTRSLSRTSIGGAGVETKNTQGSRKLTFFRSGIGVDGRAACIYRWSEATLCRVDLTFGTSTSNQKSGDKFEAYLTDTYVGNYKTTEGDTDIVKFTGKESRSRFDVFAKHFSKLSERVTFGIGAGVGSSNLEDKTTSDETIRNVLTFVVNPNGPPSPRDSVATTIEYVKWDSIITANVLAISIPVGLEFHLTQPVVFRLGANHLIRYSDTTYTNQVTSWNPPITHVVRGDSVKYDIYPNTTRTTNQSETTKRKSSRTFYTYGAGWNYSEHLQLDFMGFANLDDLTRWKLSVTMKF